NGLLNALSFSFKENMGILLENAMVKELLTKGYDIFFFKEKRMRYNSLRSQPLYTNTDNLRNELISGQAKGDRRHLRSF
ncbi:MAG: hypothetical protein RXR65_08475, partial [Hydrogenobaculum sp.]